MEKEQTLSILANIGEDSVCHKFKDLLTYDIDKKLRQTVEFKQILAVQEMPELLQDKE